MGLGPHRVREARQSADEPRVVDARNAVRGAILGLIAALVPVIALWGFTVDDALVTARVAHHLAVGLGYRFNADGPIVDAVTPLGYAYLLAPFARQGVVEAWMAARWIGVGCWLLAAGWLGAEVSRAGTKPWRWVPLLSLACCAPVAAWSGSGMETGIVTALATLALGRGKWCLVAAGLAAAWRPELGLWALVLAVGQGWAAGEWPRSLPRTVGLVAAPMLAVGLARTVAFGSPAPLAVLAKPSDLEHGFWYAMAAVIWTGLPILALSPAGLRVQPRAAAATLAFAAHLVALLLAGGDWMALFRLVVPVLPSLVLVGAWTAVEAPVWATLVRNGLAVTVGLVLMGSQAGAARAVAAHRLRLMADAAPLLADAKRVAAADVGWVGATTASHIVDLAGITDPTIAVLPGGHTTKRVGADLLRRRDVDHVVLLLARDGAVSEDWSRSEFAKGVAQRVAVEAAASQFRLEGVVALGGTPQRYIVVSRRNVE